MRKKEKIIILVLILFLSVGMYLFSSSLFAEGTVGKLLPAFTLEVNYPTWTDAIVLVANTAGTMNVPPGANWALFSGTVNFFVNYSTTATIPSSSIKTGLASELNPVLRSITGRSSLSLISSSAGIVTVSYYQ